MRQTIFFIAVLLISSSISAQIENYHERFYTISNSEGIYDFSNYKSMNFEQNIVTNTTDEVVLKVSIAYEIPKSVQGEFPITTLPPNMTQYLQPTKWVQSEDERIIAVANEIRENYTGTDLHGLVQEVLLWNARHLSYGDPSGIHDAVYALENKVVNCIGFAHLPAAILRHLGVPTRFVRTFVHRFPGFTRHYLLEVYYPEEGKWITFEPQTVSAPFDFNVFLYHDADWNPTLHQETRRFSLNPKTRVRLGRQSELEEIHEYRQFERPEPEFPHNRQVYGQQFATHGNIMAGIAYDRGEQRNNFPPNIHYDNNQIHIWEQDGLEQNLIQVLRPKDHITDNFSKRMRMPHTFTPLIFAGMMGNMQYGAPMPTQPSLSLNERFLAIPLMGYSFKTLHPENQSAETHSGVIVIWEKQADNTWSHHSNLTLPLEWLKKRTELRTTLQFDPTGDLFVHTNQGIGRFTLNENTWQPTQFIQSTKNSDKFDFGRSISFNELGNRMLVGAPERLSTIYGWESAHQGYAELYELRDNAWVSIAILQAEDGHIGDQFGHCVAVSGYRYLVGAPLNQTAGKNAGAAYIFEEDKSQRHIFSQQILRTSDVSNEDQLGGAVLLSGTQAFVAAHQKPTKLANRAGAVYYFELQAGGEWQAINLFTPNTKIHNSFTSKPMNEHLINAGHTLNTWGNQLVLGAPGFIGWPSPAENSNGTYYFFKKPIAPTEPRMIQLHEKTTPQQSGFQQLSPNPMHHNADLIFNLDQRKQVKIQLKYKTNLIPDIKVWSGILDSGTYEIRLDLIGLQPGAYHLELYEHSERVDSKSYTLLDSLSILLLNYDEDEI